MIAAPEKKLGTVRVMHFDKDMKTWMIDAHQSAIAAIALNNDGSILATSSDKVRFMKITISYIIGYIDQTMGH